jgi:hypothetical protein
MAKRVTTAQLGEKLDTLIDILSQQAVQQAAPAAAVEPAATNPTVKVDDQYLAHMTAKAADHATAKGESVVLYARRNKRGETKLAYALAPRFDEVVAKQPSCLGSVGSFQP